MPDLASATRLPRSKEPSLSRGFDCGDGLAINQFFDRDRLKPLEILFQTFAFRQRDELSAILGFQVVPEGGWSACNQVELVSRIVADGLLTFEDTVERLDG